MVYTPKTQKTKMKSKDRNKTRHSAAKPYETVAGSCAASAVQVARVAVAVVSGATDLTVVTSGAMVAMVATGENASRVPDVGMSGPPLAPRRADGGQGAPDGDGAGGADGADEADGAVGGERREAAVAARGSRRSPLVTSTWRTVRLVLAGPALPQPIEAGGGGANQKRAR